MKKCVICGKHYQESSGSQKYCSIKCVEVARREYYKKHINKKDATSSEKLTLLNIEALEHNMSYGQYVAMKEYPNKIDRKKLTFKIKNLLNNSIRIVEAFTRNEVMEKLSDFEIVL